ncbi:MAG: DUF4199 domain-containing protein [Rikenellaceae bacterium]
MSSDKSFWNEAAKYGLMLGVVMGASKIFEQSLVINGALEYAGWMLLEWFLFATLFFAILYRATKRRADSMDPALGYSFGQGVNYMMLLSILAAIPVSCLYYVYINSIVGYDNYIEGLISVMVAAAESRPIDATSANMVELLIDQVRSQPQVSIFSTLFSTVIQYAFAGLLAGLILAGFISRKPEIFEKKDEQ